MIRQQKNDSGFSLVEMMVVLVIIGLMTSAVVLSLPNTNSVGKAVLEKARLGLIAVARESVISGQIRGVRFTENGYRILTMQEGEWLYSDYENSPIWQIGELTNLTVSGADVSLLNKDDKALRPHIWFMPTGERAAFTAWFTIGSDNMRLASVPDGIEVQYEN